MRDIINPARGRIAATIGGISIAESMAAYRLANLVRSGAPPDTGLLAHVEPDRRDLVIGCATALLSRGLWDILLDAAPNRDAAAGHAQRVASHLRHAPAHAR